MPPTDPNIRGLSDPPTSTPPRAERTTKKRKRRGSRNGPATRLVPMAVAEIALGAVLILAPELLGGALPWTVALIAALCALAFVLVFLAASHRIQGTKIPMIAIVGIVALAWTGVQAAPLPCKWVERVAPESALEAQLGAATFAVAHAPLCTISRDPGATREELVKGAALLCIFLAAWMLSAVGHRESVVIGVGASVVTMAAVAAGHAIVGAQTVFGIYAPVLAGGRRVAPLLNENHLGGFLAMGVPLLLAVGIDERDRGRRLIWIGASTFTAAMAVLSFSRGAIAATVGGVLLLTAFIVFLRFVRRGRGSQLRGDPVRLLFLTFAAGVGLALYTGSETLFTEFGNHDTSKLQVALKGLELAVNHPWFGVGRGAFASVFVEHLGTTTRYVYPENILAQWASEWGIPMAALVLVTIIVVLSRAVLRSRSVIRLGATAGIMAIGLQNLVDFSLEMLGVAVVAAALVTVAITPSEQERDRAETLLTNVRSSVFLKFAVVALPLLVMCFAPFVHAYSIETLESDLREHLRDKDRNPFQDALSIAVKYHPSEPTFPLLAGAEASIHEDSIALRWLNRAMHLADPWPSPHVIAGVWLARHHAIDQSLVEIREASIRAPSSGHDAICALLRFRPEADVVTRAAPPNAGRITFLDMAATCLDATAPAVKTVDDMLMKEAPGLVAPYLRQARRDLAAHDPEAAIVTLQRAMQLTPGDTRIHVSLAEALITAGRPEEAIAMLSKAQHGLTSGAEPILRMRARAEAKAGKEEAMRRTIDDLRALANGSGPKLAETMVLLGQLESDRGNSGHALHAFEEANRFDPNSAGLQHVASLSERLGDLRRAYQAYSVLCERTAPDSSACVAKRRLTKATSELPSSRVQLPH